MRLNVRLARETLMGIQELKEILQLDPNYSGLIITNGFVVNKAFQETKDINWEEVILSKRPVNQNLKMENLDVRTNLNVSEEVIDGINDLKLLFPSILTEVSYVTTSFVIRMIIRGSLLKREGNI
ncbi:hypothetical protein [Erysipelothrix rhusiopathiae]|uniref:hypothetical protein n=1 Tax=Erysipelothrix rhusiopathiae TaxID=1648 RepID=UPI002480E684|nr:hypothetical protein [Erysipelothrix rhusiopathiae]